jgi:hypothetical protein
LECRWHVKENYGTPEYTSKLGISISENQLEKTFSGGAAETIILKNR